VIAKSINIIYNILYILIILERDMQKKRIVIGFLGTTLDEGGKKVSRWEKWRPTVALCQHEELLIDRFELFVSGRYKGLAGRIKGDITTVSPETEVLFRELEVKNPWDFEEVYETLHDFASDYPFDTEREEYLVNITTGTHVAQICLFLLTEARFLPAKLLQSSPAGSGPESSKGTYSIIDLDLSRYDRIAKRFQKESVEATSFLKSGIETRNRKFNDLIDRIEVVAGRSEAPILLMGPTGAGKSQLARRIYELKALKHRITGQFIEVNCATLRGEGAMSALFGHKKGAFTGAVTDRPGLLKSADSGLLLLDEIGELGLDEQAMLLRAIE
jgi:transcriptional regulatory protein RtcR